MRIKGFCTNAAFVNNDPSRVSQIGELTTYARTFSKDIKIYNNVDYPGLELNVFSCKEEVVSQDVNVINEVQVPDAIVELLLKISNWVYKGEVKPTTDPAEYAVELHNNDEFFNELSEVTAGDLVFAGASIIPTRLSFKLLKFDNVEVKLWFSTQVMENEYDEYEIVVINPLLDMDVLFKSVADIQQELAAVSVTTQIERTQEIKNKNPETIMVAETIQYINNKDPNIRFDLVWYVLIYGPNGNNEDAIKEAIRNAILENSSATVDDWKEILPYLFKTTRMYILPRWDRMSIPSRLDNVGIYSPISDVQEALRYASTFLSPELTTTHVEQNLEITHHKYRSITLLACGGADNALEKYRLSDYIGDYIAESSTSQDYNRQCEFTRNWTVAMEEILMLAENLNIQVSLPFGVRKVVINDSTFLSKRMGNVEWLVAIREK